MKKRVMMLLTVLFAVAVFAEEVVSGDAAVPASTQLTTMASVLIGMAIPYLFSILANFVETKPTDGPWTKLWKGTLTKILAGNYSVKAGK